MSDRVLGPGPHTRVRRLAQKAQYEASVVYSILDEARFCHVAAVVEGQAMALPTLHAREGDVVYLHASQSNAVMKSVLRSGTASITATIYDGLRLARSGFESSIAYRSVVIVGAVRPVDDDREKERVLTLFIDSILPGRSSEVRPMTLQELRLTMVIAVSIDEASAKISCGATEDSDADIELPVWAGTVPARLCFDEPIPAVDGAMARGAIEMPPSVRRLLGRA